MHDSQRGVTKASTRSKRFQTVASASLRICRLCVLVVLGMGLAIGSIEALRAETTNGSQFDLAIRNHALARRDDVIRVHRGDLVRLRWTTDARTTVHLHGYDIESELSPDGVTVMSFEAHATGRFPVNLHDEHSHGHDRTLLYLEVLPR